MKKIYCISGLGADQRVFQYMHSQEVELIPVNWIVPAKNESLYHYAERMAVQVLDKDAILMGLSFGGMMAIQLSELLGMQQVVIISSVKSRNELPAWMKLCGSIHAERLLPNRQIGSVKPLRIFRPVQDYFLGVTNEQERRIANEFRDRVDPDYLRWSVCQVFNWKDVKLPAGLVHIHGSKDHIFPISKVRPTHVIRGGGHFMIMNRYEEIQQILHSVY